MPTKYGNTLVLDRVSGKSLFKYTNKKVPLSNVPGEKVSHYQKVFDLPEAFSRQYFKGDIDITNLSEESHQYIKDKIKDATYGFFKPHSINKKNIVYKGGAQWMGASVQSARYCKPNPHDGVTLGDSGRREQQYGITRNNTITNVPLRRRTRRRCPLLNLRGRQR